jgi:hypothetical protein
MKTSSKRFLDTEEAGSSSLLEPTIPKKQSNLDEKVNSPETSVERSFHERQYLSSIDIVSLRSL